MQLLIHAFMCTPTFRNNKEIIEEVVGGGVVLMILKYGRCDTAPYMCDRQKNCAHPCGMVNIKHFSKHLFQIHFPNFQMEFAYIIAENMNYALTLYVSDIDVEYIYILISLN